VPFLRFGSLYHAALSDGFEFPRKLAEAPFRDEALGTRFLSQGLEPFAIVAT
jgi:hypothetical protein